MDTLPIIAGYEYPTVLNIPRYGTLLIIKTGYDYDTVLTISRNIVTTSNLFKKC